jgi:hypothetical protein
MENQNIITVNGLKYALINEEAKEETVEARERVNGKFCAAYKITKPNGDKVIRAQLTRPVSLALSGKHTQILDYCKSWEDAESLVEKTDAILEGLINYGKKGKPNENNTRKK